MVSQSKVTFRFLVTQKGGDASGAHSLVTLLDEWQNLSLLPELPGVAGATVTSVPATW